MGSIFSKKNSHIIEKPFGDFAGLWWFRHDPNSDLVVSNNLEVDLEGVKMTFFYDNAERWQFTISEIKSGIAQLIDYTSQFKKCGLAQSARLQKVIIETARMQQHFVVRDNRFYTDNEAGESW